MKFQRASCAYCHDRIWGLGRQGFKCIQCKLLVHKKCHKVVRSPCISQQQQQQQQSHLEQQTSERNGEQQQLDSPQSSPPTHLEDDTTEASTVEDHAYRNRKYFCFCFFLSFFFRSLLPHICQKPYTNPPIILI